jgi:hypothetical protein
MGGRRQTKKLNNSKSILELEINKSIYNSFSYFKKDIHTSNIMNSLTTLLPLKTYSNLSGFKNYKSELKNIGGVYGFLI